MTAKPNSTINESLSALMDGECNDLDLQRVLKSMDTDDSESVRQTWARYHAVPQIIRGTETPDFSIDLSKSIMQAIDEEPAVGRSAAGLNTWWRGVGKTAVAACATVGVVFGVQQYTASPDSASNIAAVAEVNEQGSTTAPGAVVPLGFELPPLQARTVSTNTFSPQNKLPQSPASKAVRASVVVSSDEFQDQINRLMFKHAEQVSSSGGMGAIPFARISELSEKEKE